MTTPTPRPKRSLDTYLSLLAVVASFCAMGITFYQAYLQRIQQYASVIPILETYHTNHLEDGSHGSAMALINQGLGPAFIDSVHYYYQKRPYGSISRVLRASLSTAQSADSTLVTSDLEAGRVVPANQTIHLYQTRGRVLSRHLDQQYESIRLVIYYHSIYGQGWVFDSGQRGQKRTRSHG